MVNRNEDWQTRLGSFILGASQQKLKYGLMDCGIFCAGAIEAMTGINVIADLQPYSSRRGAYKAIKAMCGSATVPGVAKFLAERSGAKEVPVLMAHRGDPVVIDDSSFGIIALDGIAILTPSRDGIIRLELNRETRAFHIGR